MAPARLAPVGARSTGTPVVATRIASRKTTAYSTRARARGPGPAARRMVNNTTTTPARAMVSRPRRDRPGAGSRRATGAPGRATWSGRPAPPAAERYDGFAVVAAGGAVSTGLGAAVQGDAAGHTGHGPGAVTQVDQPDGTSGHDGTPS